MRRDYRHQGTLLEVREGFLASLTTAGEAITHAANSYAFRAGRPGFQPDAERRLRAGQFDEGSWN